MEVFSCLTCNSQHRSNFSMNGVPWSVRMSFWIPKQLNRSMRSLAMFQEVSFHSGTTKTLLLLKRSCAFSLQVAIERGASLCVGCMLAVIQAT